MLSEFRQRTEFAQVAVPPDEDRPFKCADKDLAQHPGSEERVAGPGEQWQADHGDRTRDPNGMEVPANSIAMIQPVRCTNADCSQSSDGNLGNKNLQQNKLVVGHHGGSPEAHAAARRETNIL